VAQLRRQMLRAQAREGEGSETAKAAEAALEQRQSAAEVALLSELSAIKAAKRRRHEAKKEKRRQRKKAKSLEKGPAQPPTLTLAVGNLARDLDVETAVRELFERHGVAVSKVKAVGTRGGRAKVTVASEEDVAAGCALHRRMLAGRPVTVERGGPGSGTEEAAAALAEAQAAMARALLEEAGLERLLEDEQLLRHLAYHHEDTGRKALAYFMEAAQEGARNEAALLSALLKKQAQMEDPLAAAKAADREAGAERRAEEFPWQGGR